MIFFFFLYSNRDLSMHSTKSKSKSVENDLPGFKRGGGEERWNGEGMR